MKNQPPSVRLLLGTHSGPEDASKILTSDSSCPVCEQLLSKRKDYFTIYDHSPALNDRISRYLMFSYHLSNMKAVELAPGDDWVNMVMAGTPPQSIMKSAYKGVMFWIGQKEVESQITINKAMHLKQKYEEMQQKYMEKLEQVHGAYQKAMKKVQHLEHEKESLIKDKKELQEKYTEKSRQKRKLEEMYEALRNEYEQQKRNGGSNLQKDNMVVKRIPQYGFTQTPGNYNDGPKSRHQSGGIASHSPHIAPITPSPVTYLHHKESIASGLFDIPSLPGTRNRGAPGASPIMGGGAGLSRHNHNQPSGLSPFHENDASHMFTPAGGNASVALRNLLLSPMRKQSNLRMRSGPSR